MQSRRNGDSIKYWKTLCSGGSWTSWAVVEDRGGDIKPQQGRLIATCWAVSFPQPDMRQEDQRYHRGAVWKARRLIVVTKLMELVCNKQQVVTVW